MGHSSQLSHLNSDTYDLVEFEFIYISYINQDQYLYTSTNQYLCCPAPPYFQHQYLSSFLTKNLQEYNCSSRKHSRDRFIRTTIKKHSINSATYVCQ